MNLLDFVFRLGVLFAIYGFLWGIIEIGLWILSSGRIRSKGLSYFIKAIKYFFLADVTFLFCLDAESSNMVEINRVIFAGIILLTYFIGKLQQNQNRSMLFKFAGRGLPVQQNNFNMQMEVLVIAISLVIFSSFWFFPEFSLNPISLWFKESIVNIEDTPVFGFIFKIIGFFFLVSLLFKMASAFTFLLSGGKGPTAPMDPTGTSRNDDSFDDFEEIS